MKIGILGGSFNPAHLGHVHLSEIAIKKLALNQLWWIPTSQNPLKKKNDYLTFEKRVKNCQIITQKNPKIYVKKIANFYSIDLINSLQKKYKNYEFIWVMGADNLEDFHRWHDFKNLIQKIEFAIFSRDNYLKKTSNFKALKLYKKFKNKSKKLPKFSIFNTPKFNISSTQIRNEKMYNYIVDTHCHLDLIEEKGIRIEEILENCEEKNVKILQTICTKISSVEKILKYTENNQNIYSSVGLHPCNVSIEEFRTASEILAICEKNSKIIGIGETGLDYYHDLSQVELQKKSFLEHIEASAKSDLPLIIHSRNADENMMEILKNEQKNHKFPALLHCFSSSPALARCALDLGIYISIAGIVTFKNAEELQRIVKEIPLEFLLIETDSPYLAPMPHRGKTNQPAYTFFVAEYIAKLKNLEVEKVIEQTTKNFHKIFKRAKIIN